MLRAWKSLLNFSQFVLYEYLTFFVLRHSFHFSFLLLSQQSSRFVNIPIALFMCLANTLTYEYTNFTYKINKDRQHGKRVKERGERRGSAPETTRMNDNVCDVGLTSPWGTISIIRPQTRRTWRTQTYARIWSNLCVETTQEVSAGSDMSRQTTSNMLALQLLVRKKTNTR